MPNVRPKENQIEALRKRAEAVLAFGNADDRDLPPERVRALVHELRTHRIELEMQNEQLRLTQEELVESRNRYVDLYDFPPVVYQTAISGKKYRTPGQTGRAKIGVSERSFNLPQKGARPRRAR